MAVTLNAVFETTKLGLGMSAATIASKMGESLGAVEMALEELVKQKRVRRFERGETIRYRCVLKDAAWVDAVVQTFIERAVEYQETDFGFDCFYTPEDNELNISPARFRVAYGYIANTSLPAGASKSGHESFYFDVGVIARLFDVFPKIWASSEPNGFMSFEGKIDGELANISINFGPLIGQPYVGKLHTGGRVEFFDEPEPSEEEADTDQMEDIIANRIEEAEQRSDELLEDEDGQRDEGGQG